MKTRSFVLSPRVILLPLAFFAALATYLALATLTGRDAALFRQGPRAFVPPAPPVVRKRAEPPQPPPIEVTPATPTQPPLSDWTKLPSRY